MIGRTKYKVRRTKDKATGIRALSFVFCPLFFVLCVAGCCHHSDQVERELRHREHELNELRDAFEQSRALNMAFAQELCQQRQPSPQPAVRESSTPEKTDSSKPEILPLPSTAPSPGDGKAAQQVVPANTIKDVVLGRQTGGYNQGREPGDDSLQVVLEPRDYDGSTIKAFGCLHVTALEIVPEGLKRPLSSWDISVDQLRRTWKSGFFGCGYYVVLPWKCCPTTEKLRVVAQFTLADGRLFEADKDVTIHLPHGLKPTHAPLPQPAVEESGPTLPMPHKVDKPLQPTTWRQAGTLNGAVQLLRPE
jgi:hypothetical protein